MATVLERPATVNGSHRLLRHERHLVERELTEQEFDGVDLEAIKRAVRTILKAVGEDPDRSGLLETPRRVAKMYAEMFSGLHQDPARHLKVTFPEDYDELVLVRDIPFTSMFNHHQCVARHLQNKSVQSR